MSPSPGVHRDIGAHRIRINGTNCKVGNNRPAARGCGLGALLMGELERDARGHGLSLLRLDTRHDLVESRRLYAALGYEEVPAFNDGQYAEHWLAKPLA
jgi:GNAT superfamily N-acetyltransferase